MPKFECYPIDDEDTLWMYCPSYGAAIAFCALFAITTVGHIIQASLYRKPFFFVLIMGGLWETAGYAFRIMSVRDQHSEPFATAQLLLIILAPLWINAFVYMLLGRMIHFYLAKDRVFGIRARRITLMFVCFDITAFLIQVTGGMMLNTTFPAATQKIGMNTYMAGVGVQIFFICVFLALAIQFSRLVKQEDLYTNIDLEPNTSSHPPKSARQALRLLYVIYAILLLLMFRNVYRLIEFSAGIESSITKQEWYTFVFDSVPMLLCLVVLNTFHPGKVLRGPRCDFSEENKEMKEMKKARKAMKQAGKDEKKAMKQAGKEEKKAMKHAGKEEKKNEKLMQSLKQKQEKDAMKESKRQNNV